jgi:hypothetical protein
VKIDFRKNSIIYLVKFFEKKEYAESFLNGELYLNTLSFFKKYDKDEGDGRGDPYEAPEGWYQPNQIELKLGEHVFNDIVAPVIIQKPHHDSLNLLCLTACHAGMFTQVNSDNINDFKKQLSLDEDVKRLGELAVMILEPEKFLEKIFLAAEERGISLEAGLVQYFEEDFSGSFTGADVLFKKHENFSFQSEYRVVMDINEEHDSENLYIGDIRDIAKFVKVEELINPSIKLKPKESDLID